MKLKRSRGKIPYLLEDIMHWMATGQMESYIIYVNQIFKQLNKAE